MSPSAKSWLKIGLSVLIIAAAATVVYRMIYANNPYRQAADLFSGLFNRKSMLQASLSKQTVPAPEITGIAQWFNTQDGQPVKISDLRGHVVIVDFWTYSCINCIRTMPYITAWDRKYRDFGLVILGVHTPEFAFEKVPGNVAKKIKEYGIEYPVALDNNYGTWNAYDNQFWPAKYFIDHEGNVVWRHFGEGQYEESEAKIQELLIAAGGLKEKLPLGETGPSADVTQMQTPEIYFGYDRMDHFGGRIARDQEVAFPEPSAVANNTFYLTGTWFMGREHMELRSPTGKIILRYHANKANIVLQAAAEVTAEVRLDGNPLESKNRGRDVFPATGGRSEAKIKEPRLYNFTDTGDDYGWHTLELIFSRPGVQAFAFTFG